MNNIILSGRLVDNLKIGQSKKSALARIAVKRPFPYSKDINGNEITDFFNLKFLGFNKVDNANKLLFRGIKINVKGILCHDSWRDESDAWHDFSYIIVEDWEFCESMEINESMRNKVYNNNFTVKEEKKDDYMNVDGFSRVQPSEGYYIPFE